MDRETVARAEGLFNQFDLYYLAVDHTSMDEASIFYNGIDLNTMKLNSMNRNVSTFFGVKDTR